MGEPIPCVQQVWACHKTFVMDFFEKTYPLIAMGIIGAVLLYAIFSKTKKEK